MSFRRKNSSILFIALAVAVGLALAGGAKASDAFTITAPLSGRAITSCSDIVMSGGSVDSAGVNAPSPTNKGNVATNGNLTLSGSSTIHGDALVGPGKKITKSGTASVTGTSSVATATFDCKPIDLIALKTTLQSTNDNARMPQTGQHHNPLTGANHTDFVMSGSDTLAIPSGTYYLTSFAVSGSSVITTTGPVHILVSGSVSMSGGSIAGSNAYGLHLWISGTSFALSSSTAKAFVYAPSAAASLSSATLAGGLFANTVVLSGSAHVTRLIDDAAPSIAITSPANGTAVADPVHVLVKGTVSDDQTDVSVSVNGHAATVAADGTWQVTLDISSGGSPATITAIATDAGGNTAQATVNVITTAPAISLTSPAPGALLATHVVNLSGSAGTATSLSVNGTPATIAGGLWSLTAFDLGADGAHTLTITGTNAAGGTTISPVLTTDTTPPVVTTSIAPPPNAAGWNRTAPTVTFTCTDATSGVATCPAAVTVSAETSSQSVNGTATDKAGNQRNASAVVKLDLTTPLIAVTSPANGATVTTPSLTVNGTVSDALSGVAGVTCNGSAATISGGTFTCSVTLVSGNNTVTATATDIAGNTAVSSVHVTYTTPVTLTSLAVIPSATTVTQGQATQLQAIATYSDNTTSDVTATAAWSSSARAIASVVAGTVTGVSAGNATITATVGTISGSALVTVTSSAPTVTSLAVAPTTANLTTGSTFQLTANATYSDNSTQNVTSSATWTSDTTAVATVTSGLVTAVGPGSAVITASFGGISATASIGVTTGQQLPPDPATIAPPIDQTVTTTMFASTSFLYTGDNPIQVGVTPGTIDSVRAAVIRGRVLAHGGQPLPGVTVAISGHPEFGSTLSRADGMFDLAVNGGATLAVRYSKSAFITAFRNSQPSQNDFAVTDDVILTAYDPAVTAIDLTATGVQVARGSVMTDDSGSRRATILFPAGTTATMTMADGSLQAITTMHVRATEFTVGPEGPKAMPASLPAASGYTYCVDLSADEATVAGATSVSFSAPVALYFENYLQFHPGNHIPVGAYDPAQSVWIPSDNGKVVAIVAIVDGLAYLDVTGDGVADGPDAMAALGITDAERATLATMYGVNQQLWRVPIAHFSLWDANDPYGPVPGSRAPRAPKPSVPGNPRDKCCQAEGSIISVENGSLGEDIPVAGTPLFLHYESTRLRTIGPRTVQVSVIGDDPPPAGTQVELEVQAAGQHTVMELSPQANLTVGYTWDGKDAYGRPVQGAVPISFRTKYTYKAVYQVPDVPPELFHLTTPLFDQLSGIPSFDADWPNLTYSFTSDWVTTSRQNTTVGQWNPRGLNLGGWSLSAQHFYDYRSGILHMGDGSQRKMQGVSSIITTIAGNPNGPQDDGTLAKDASLGSPGAMAYAADGTLYFAQGGTISRIDPTGHLYKVAETGSTSPDRIAVAKDGSIYVSFIRDRRLSVIRGGAVSDVSVTDPLTGSALAPEGLAADDQNNLWVATGMRVYKLNAAGTILDWIGNGQTGTDGDDGPAHTAPLILPANVAIAPDGDIFIGSPSNDNIRYVTPDGTIHTLLSGADASFGSGGPIRAATGFAVDRGHNIFVTDGNLFFNQHSVVEVIGPDGSRVRIAGGSADYSGDGGPALVAGLQAQDVVIGPDGALYVSDTSRAPNNPFDSARIRRIGSPMPGLGRDELALPSADASELYVFTVDGRHLRTQDALTGDVRLRFGYDTTGCLTTITDIHNNVVTVERDKTTRQPVAIVAPGGQRTTLAVGNDGYFSSIANPAGESYGFGYSNDGQGLMTSLADPKHQTHTFSYDVSGLLLVDTDPSGGSTTLNRTGDDSNFTVTRTTGEGRQSTYQVTTANDGSYSETIVDAAGNTSQQSGSADGKIQSNNPDGMNVSVAQSPDPRFGIQAPVGTSNVLTPGGRRLSILTQRAVTMTSDPTPALASFTETTTVSGDDFESTFDVPSRTWTMTSTLGRTATEILDGQGEVVSTAVPGLTPVQYQRDSRGRMTSVAQGARNIAFGYDSANHLTSITDPLQRTVTFGYDLADRVVQQTLSDGRVIGFGYDANGNLTSLTPPSRPSHGFTFTPVDLVSSYAPPPVTPGGATLYSYNRDRQLTQVDHPDGRSVALTYDPAGRPSALTIARGSILYEWEDGTGHLTSLTAPDDGVVSFDYDGALLTDATWEGPVSGSISWDYDSRFNVSAETVNCATSTKLACQTAFFNYDGDGLLVNAGPLNLDNDPSNGLLTDTQTGQVTDVWSYNEFGEPTAYTASVNGIAVFSQQYTRDGLGRITAESETTGSSAATYGYGYDTTGRLTDVTDNGATAAHYTYDENGNRLTRLTSARTESATVDAQDRLLTYADARYTYTSGGELATKTDGTGTTSYDYDEFGNLLGVSLPSGHRIDYVIDAENRRIGKKMDGILVQRFLYGRALGPVAEIDGDGNVAARFIYATRPNVPDLIIKGDVIYRVIIDHTGSPRVVVNSDTGEIAATISYDELGNVLSDSNPGFQPFGFAGGLFDPDTNLLRFGARDYDPRIGRWTTKDPLSFGGSDSNLYEYAYNDPVNFIDPTGLDAITDDPDGLAIMASLYRKANAGLSPYEQNALILRDPATGKLLCFMLPSSHSANKNTFTNVKHPWRVAYIHTHPYGRTERADQGADPSAATTLGIPLYALSRTGIHKIDPNDTNPHDTEELNANNYLKQNHQDWWNAPDTNNCGCH